MSESIYPNAIDGYAQLPLVIDTVTRVDAISVNRLRCAIANIENELGVLPSGTFPTVRARLDAIELAIGDAGGIDIDALIQEVTQLRIDVDALQLAGFLTLITDDILIEGELVIINNAGNVELGGASSISDAKIIGASTGSFAVSSTATINAAAGNLVPVRFSTPPAGASNGSSVFLSTTYGLGTIIPPSASGDVVYFIGILQGADGATSIPLVILQPRLVAEIG